MPREQGGCKSRPCQRCCSNSRGARNHGRRVIVVAVAAGRTNHVQSQTWDASETRQPVHDGDGATRPLRGGSEAWGRAWGLPLQRAGSGSVGSNQELSGSSRGY